MRRQPRNRQRSFEKNDWYDLIDDWGLIEASFTAQYGIRLRSEPDMTWSEFSTLLVGIMPKTPLGQVVQIRSEENKDVLKNFTPEQHRIRNEWRSRKVEALTDYEKGEKIKEIQEIFAKAFSK